MSTTNTVESADNGLIETRPLSTQVRVVANDEFEGCVVDLTPAEAVRVAFHLIGAAQAVDYTAAAAEVRLIRDLGGARSSE